MFNILLIIILIFILVLLSNKDYQKNSQHFYNLLMIKDKAVDHQYNISWLPLNFCIVKENFQSIHNLLDKSQQKFPYRFLKDENNNIIPIVALTAFFRNDEDKKLYYSYLNADIKVIGVTAYKTFPIKIRDVAEDTYHIKDDFNYIDNIKVWLACVKNLELYNFDQIKNITIDISESDFYNTDYTIRNKIYDFIYICNKDKDSNECSMNGWNAINRNYELALKCFPIMINEYKLKGLCVGRIGCDLSQFGDNITITDFLPYNELQEKMRESKCLFLPNIYDASPRVVGESLTKGLPVLMNQNIIAFDDSTPLEHFACRSNQASFSISPDGKHMLIQNTIKDNVCDIEQDYSKYVEDEAYDNGLILWNLDTGETKTLSQGKDSDKISAAGWLNNNRIWYRPAYKMGQKKIVTKAMNLDGKRQKIILERNAGSSSEVYDIANDDPEHIYILNNDLQF